MAADFVPGQKASASSTPAVATLAVSFPATTKKGNLLCAHAAGTNAITSITDDGSNTWLNDFAVQDPNVSGDEVWHTYNAAAALTVTIHFATTGAFCFIAVSEYSGIQRTSDPKDQTSHRADGGTAGSSTTADVTPTTSGQLIYVVDRCTGLGPATWNGSFTLLSNSGQADGDGYYIQPLAAPIHADANNTGDTHWHVGIVTFFAALEATLHMPKTMRGPQVRFKMPRPQVVPDFIPIPAFDPAFMAAMDRPRPDQALDVVAVAASGMTPPDVLPP